MSLAVLTALLLCACQAGPVSAGPISVFNTFGEPGDTFNGKTGGSGQGASVGGGTGPNDYDASANQLFPSADVTLDSLRVAAFSGSGPGFMDVVLAADNAGVPGVPLEVFSSVSVPLPAGGSVGAIITLNSSLHPQLDAGTSYWLVLEPHDPLAPLTAGWNLSLPEVHGVSAVQTSPGGPWQNRPEGILSAFEVLGNPPVPFAPPPAVPEPSSLTLLGFGGLALAGWRRWKGKRATP
jgi:PEP-CTERM motif